MIKMFSVFTVLLTISTNVVIAKECKELELGSVGRNYWVDSLGNGFRGEFEKQVRRKDDLFSPLLPELEFDIGPRAKFNLTFTREVDDHLPKPENNTINSTDLFSLRVDNNLHLEVGTGLSGPYLYTGASMGLSLRHVSHQIPGKNNSQCEFYNSIIDKSTPEGELLGSGIKEACFKRKKTRISKYYESAINYGSSLLSKALDFVVDSEKNEVFISDTLAPLKLHSTLGIPMDHEVFFENNSDLNIGDYIEHTTFVNLTPVGISFDIYGVFSPGVSRFARLYRTVTFKKELRNQVLVEIEDTFIQGNNTLIYKIRPKILGILKLNIGRWTFDKYNQESIRQKLSVNLNDPKGRSFFKKLLFSLYKHSVNVHKNSVLIDTEGYEKAVTTFPSVYTDSVGDDHKLEVKFPGLFSYEDKSYTSLKDLTVGGRKITRGEVLHKESFENKVALNLGLFEIKRADRHFECEMRLSSDVTVKIDGDHSLNIDCRYGNKYATNDHVKDISEYLNMALSGKLSQRTKEILSKLNYQEKDILNMYSNISFSKSQVEKIIQSSEEEIYNAISGAIFGPRSKNVFSKKYHKLWKRAALDYTDRKHKTQLYKINSCSELLNKLGITEEKESLYDRFEGVVGKNRGISQYKHYRCYGYYLMAKDFAKRIKKLQLNAKNEHSLNFFLHVFQDLDEVGLIQAVLANLAGGVSPSNVRYTYYVSSPNLSEIIAETNGKNYEIESDSTLGSLRDEMGKTLIPRITKVKFLQNTCEKDVLYAVFKMKYKPADRKNTFAKFTLTEFSTLKDRPIGEYYFSFDEIIKNVDGEYIARIALDKPLSDTQAHNMYMEIMNEKDYRLSRELKVYMKKVRSILGDVLNLNVLR